MTYTLRPATASDDATIHAMIRRARLNPLGLDWRRFLVAEADGEIIGIGQMKTHGDDSRELASLAVIPTWQGRGVGRALVHALLDGDPGPIYLTCAVGLEGYYEQFGFQMLDSTETPYFRRLMALVGVLGAGARLFGGDMRVSLMRRDADKPVRSPKT